ncbi:MAG: cobalamin-binding protein, partial [Eubacterium sp.]
ILGLSGLLSGATRSVFSVIEGINKAGLRDNIKIIVGGGMMNKQDEIGEIYADAYVKSSERGIEYCNEWTEKRR